jgi:hypothetical protein
MRRRCTFRKADLIRATKAVQAVGLEVARVEVSREGLIVVVPCKLSDNATKPNEWDEVLHGKTSIAVR